MNNYAVWKLPTFCRFYGRVVPTNQVGGNKFTQFRTGEDELQVKFDNGLEPETMMGIVICASSYYVVGHGEASEEWGGRTFFDSYTMFDKDGLVKFLESCNLKEGVDKVLSDIEKMDQAIIRLL